MAIDSIDLNGMEAYVLGIDYGMDSVRSTFVDTTKGEEIKPSVFTIQVGVMESLAIHQKKSFETFWKPYPDMLTGGPAWILVGGAHTGCQNLTVEHIQDFVEMTNIKFTLIGKDTSLYQFKNEMRWNEMYYR